MDSLVVLTDGGIDWFQILTSVILALVGAVISISTPILTTWLLSKIKDEKAKKFTSEFLKIINDAVSYVYQTYVENIKGTSLWDETAMKKANDAALAYVEKNLSADLKAYFEKNGIDIENYIKDQIEIAINAQKSAATKITISK